MIKWNDFKDQFDPSWHKWVQPIIESEQFNKDFGFLKNDAKKMAVYPSGKSGNLFRIFREVKYDDMLCVVVGLSPYKGTLNNTEIADGIALSCGNTRIEQPSLTKWYDAMKEEFGQNIVREPDLSYLCKRGVFLYNYCLTVTPTSPTEHEFIWEHFTKTLFETAIFESSVPVITLGKVAAKTLEWSKPWVISEELYHPSYAARSQIKWDTKGIFKKVQDFLIHKGHPFKWVIEKEKF